MNTSRNACMYIGCHNAATMDWRLVPVCERHYDDIRIETMKYYAGTVTNDNRIHYSKIKGLIK